MMVDRSVIGWKLPIKACYLMTASQQGSSRLARRYCLGVNFDGLMGSSCDLSRSSYDWLGCLKHHLGISEDNEID
jgi:hypothetical protein